MSTEDEIVVISVTLTPRPYLASETDSRAKPELRYQPTKVSLNKYNLVAACASESGHFDRGCKTGHMLCYNIANFINYQTICQGGFSQ